MVLFAAAVAPLVHRVLDKERARTLTRAIFPVYYLVLAIMAGLAAIAGFLVNVAAGLVLAVIAGWISLCAPGDDAAHQRAQRRGRARFDNPGWASQNAACLVGAHEHAAAFRASCRVLVFCAERRISRPPIFQACKRTSRALKRRPHSDFSSGVNAMAHAGDVNKVVLAYSGGLDTSIILKWLQTEYGAEVVTFTADLGQGEELEPARKKAEMLGIKEIYVDDLREEFVSDFVFPMFRANAVYEGVYLLGTSIARPLISKRLVEIARETGADAVAHGATGKGNDQIRFELNAYALDPDIKVIAPWREWDFKSREALLEFAEKHQIPVPKDKRGEAPFSVDANLLHSSSEGKVLEDPNVDAPEYVHMRTVSPMDAPDAPTKITIGFEKGDAVRSMASACRRQRFWLGSTIWAGTMALAGSIWWRTGLSA
jgi:hypothetical protein